MGLKKYIFLIISLFFCYSSVVMAESCDDADIKRLKVLADNIDISYDYNDDIYDTEGFPIYDTYKIVINNISDEFYIMETTTDTYYGSYAIKDGTLSIDRMYGGNKAFQIYSKTCGKIIKTESVTLPKFNFYSTDPICEGKEYIDVCQKFYDTSKLEYNQFYDQIVSSEKKNEVKDENKSNKDILIDFIKDNYIYIGIGIVVLLIVITLLVIRHRKRGVLE